MTGSHSLPLSARQCRGGQLEEEHKLHQLHQLHQRRGRRNVTLEGATSDQRGVRVCESESLKHTRE